MQFNISSRAALASALLAGSVALMASGPSANAQNLAAAAPSSDATAKPRPGYVVFFEQNSTKLSPAATDTIRLAAESARANKAKVIRIVGSADHAKAVKDALVLQGVLPTQIALVGRDDTGPIVRASTGMPEPLNRSVLIAF